MARKYQILYKDLNELLHLAGIDKTIIIIREGVKNLKHDDRPPIVIDNDLINNNFYVKKLLNCVCEIYKCKREGLIAYNTRTMIQARKLCYYIMKFKLDMQYDDIGYVFGKDKSTICRGITAFHKEADKKPELNEKRKNVEEKMADVIAQKMAAAKK